jgi:hypothetical protein
MRTLLLSLPLFAFAELCMVEEFGLGDGRIVVSNRDAETHEVMVSDKPNCFAGMRTELRGNTTRDFDIDEKGAYLCIGKGGGVLVENGARYTVRGGAVSRER